MATIDNFAHSSLEDILGARRAELQRAGEGVVGRGSGTKQSAPAAMGVVEAPTSVRTGGRMQVSIPDRPGTATLWVTGYPWSVWFYFNQSRGVT